MTETRRPSGTTTAPDSSVLDAALDRSQRDREAAAALQAAVEQLLQRTASTPWARLAASRSRQL